MSARAREAFRKDVHERALGLLAVRPRSRRELERRLSAAGFDDDEVADELERLERVGLVDDEAFARALAEHAFERRKAGRRAVASALAAKGVAPAVASAVLDDLDGAGDADRADDLAQARAVRLAGVPADKAFQRLTGFLVRRGHAPEAARDAARRALRLDGVSGAEG
ncbi:MAG TPA: regulatory protein RecX [Actinomycetota bacterium]|nr:regulatory protein RecX [Actinomycetota bacterium]